MWEITEELNEALKVKKNLVVEGLADAGSDVCVTSNAPAACSSGCAFRSM